MKKHDIVKFNLVFGEAEGYVLTVSKQSAHMTVVLLVDIRPYKRGDRISIARWDATLVRESK